MKCDAKLLIIQKSGKFIADYTRKSVYKYNILNYVLVYNMYIYIMVMHISHRNVKRLKNGIFKKSIKTIICRSSNFLK